MIITRVECFILDKQFPFVKVHTDAGITGIGEIFRRNARIYKAAVESVLAPSLIGKDPLNAEALWQEMSRAGVAIDTRSAVYCAMAGVDRQNPSRPMAPAPAIVEIIFWSMATSRKERKFGWGDQAICMPMPRAACLQVCTYTELFVSTLNIW